MPAESFACDIELLLGAEPIAGTPTIPTNLLSPLGYAFERRQHSKPLSDDPQSVEIRSFCRVLKSRYTPNQSRRCAYDIAPGQGVVFTETYPGDGALLLFHENAKQRTLWETFLSRDVPLQFPALRYTLFDRTALQRVFATQRRFNQLHQKTDMFLACFDSYWINWYWQLGRRSIVRMFLQSAFPNAHLPTDAETRSTRKNRLDELKKRARQRWSRFLCCMDDSLRDSWKKRKLSKGVPPRLNKDLVGVIQNRLCKGWVWAEC